ncbi:ribonuclease H-like domain-containing protein [Lentinula raphanica]|nr:ribonuclease H-like domain-containing protein [Lentinula raphanica]
MATVNQIPPAAFFTTQQFYAISCVNVGIGPGGMTSMLARIAVVDLDGNSILDTYVMPTMEVIDYRTATTGIQAAHLSPGNAVAFDVVQQHVATIIQGNILVGHSIWNDLSVLGLAHPAFDIRDVALYQPFRNAVQCSNNIFSLQTLSLRLRNRIFLEGGRNPLENARGAGVLYLLDGVDWEAAIGGGNWPCALPPCPSNYL